MFKKGKTNMIATIVLLIAIYILNIIDYLQTAYGIQMLGLDIEANPIGRFCFEHNCALAVKLIGVLIILLIIGFITIKIEPRYICLSFAIFVIYMIIVWHNFCQLEQAGILNFNQLDEPMIKTIAITSFVMALILAGVCGGLLSYIKHLKITIKELEKYNDGFEYKAYWGCDLQTEHERCLTEKIYKKPVMVYDYPKEIKAFYMKLNEDGKTVRAVDMLVPGLGEIIGGSERESDLEKLTNRIKELGMNPEDYWWYLDLRKYGTVPHAGFGLGFERLLRYVTGMANIRDVIPYPRAPKLADF
jgi:hypothetical protein